MCHLQFFGWRIQYYLPTCDTFTYQGSGLVYKTLAQSRDGTLQCLSLIKQAKKLLLASGNSKLQNFRKSTFFGGKYKI